MISVTFNSAPAFLLDNFPDWNSAVTLDAELPLSFAPRGLSGREERRPYGDTLRVSLKYSALLQGSEVVDLRNSLQALNTQAVLCPLWVAGFDAGATPNVTSAYYVMMGDGDAPAIAAAAALPFDRPAYPLLIGRLENLPDPEMLTDVCEAVTFEFTENDPRSISLSSFVAPTGLTAGSGVRPLFPFRADWATSPHAGSAEVEIDRRAIGDSRSMSDAYYAQRSRRHGQQNFTLFGNEGWQMLRFWLDQLGTQNNFWLPSALSEAQLVADVGAGDTTLQANAVGPSTPFYICLDDLVNRTPLKISESESESASVNTWTLSGAVGTDYASARTRIESLVLSRFDDSKISLTWESPDVVTCQLKFVEVPWEVASVSGEIFGTSMGALPVTAHLYVFTVNYPDGAAVYRYTSFERDLTNAGNTYSATGSWEHDDITETATIERQSTKLRTRNFTGNPLSLLAAELLEFPLLVDIFECDVTEDAASNLRAIFSGEAEELEREGPFIEATVSSLSHLFDQQIPRALFQTADNWMLFSTYNGLSRTDWKWTGIVADTYDPTTTTLPLTNVTRSTGPAITLDEHFFAGGYLTIGTGTNIQFRGIGDSGAVASGTMNVTLATDFAIPPAPGDLVTFYPGYDGDYSTATDPDTFNNRANFGGFPFMPIGDNSLLYNLPNLNQGAKK